MKPTNAAETRLPTPREDKNLDRRYGEIGISAVAAAVRYQGEPKNPADAPVKPSSYKWLEEMAA